MRGWLIRQDRPNGGVLSFAGDPAFEAHWLLSADPPSTDSLEPDSSMADSSKADCSRADCSKAGEPSTDSPEGEADQQSSANDERYWFRTGEDEDDLIVQFFNLHWQDAPPDPALARRLMSRAVSELNEVIGERF